MSYIPLETPWGFTHEPKISAFLKEFPFIEEKYWGLLRSGSGMIFPQVQRMDKYFMYTCIIKQRWWERLILGSLLTKGILFLDEKGDKIAEVGEESSWVYLPYAHQGGWHKTETVYQALRRIGPENINRVKYGFYYFNRGGVPDVVIYKLPKGSTLLEVVTEYAEETRRTEI